MRLNREMTGPKPKAETSVPSPTMPPKRKQIRKPDVSALLERLQTMRERTDSVSAEEYEKLNQDIHMTLWNVSGNKRIKTLLMDLWNGPSTGETAEEKRHHYAESTAEHIEILEAVQRGDKTTAQEVMKKHILRSMENILKYYQ